MKREYDNTFQKKVVALAMKILQQKCKKNKQKNIIDREKKIKYNKSRQYK